MMCAFMGAGAWVYGLVGDVTATAQGGGWGVCVIYSDSTRTKDPQASYVGRTSGLAASRPNAAEQTFASSFTSPALCTCRAVHHKCVCVRASACVCARACVCTNRAHLFVSYVLFGSSR